MTTINNANLNLLVDMITDSVDGYIKGRRVPGNTVFNIPAIKNLNTRWKIARELILTNNASATSDLFASIIKVPTSQSVFYCQMLGKIIQAKFPGSTMTYGTRSIRRDTSYTAEIITLQLPSSIYDIIRLMSYMSYATNNMESITVEEQEIAASSSSTLPIPVKNFKIYAHNLIGRTLNAIALVNPELWSRILVFYASIRDEARSRVFFDSVKLCLHADPEALETMQPTIVINSDTFIDSINYEVAPVIQGLNKIAAFAQELLDEFKEPLWITITKYLQNAEAIRRKHFMKQASITLSELEKLLNRSILVTNDGDVLRVNIAESTGINVSTAQSEHMPASPENLPIVTKMNIITPEGNQEEIVVVKDEVIQAIMRSIQDARFIATGTYRYAAEDTSTTNPAETTGAPIIRGIQVGSTQMRDGVNYVWRQVSPTMGAWFPDDLPQAQPARGVDTVLQEDDFEDAIDDDDDDDDDDDEVERVVIPIEDLDLPVPPMHTTEPEVTVVAQSVNGRRIIQNADGTYTISH